MQFIENIMNQIRENGEKPNSDPILARLAQIFALTFFVGLTATRC